MVALLLVLLLGTCNRTLFFYFVCHSIFATISS